MFVQCHENKKRLELIAMSYPPNSTLDLTKKEMLLVELILEHITHKLSQKDT